MKKLKFSLLAGLLLVLCTFSACSQKVLVRSDLEASTGESPKTEPSLVLNITYEELIPGEAFRLIPLVRPIQQYTPEYRFSTSDPEIAEVDETGLVTAKGLGRCVIEVTTAGTVLSSSCTVDVVEQHSPVETPTVDPSTETPSVTPSLPSPATETPTSPDTSETPSEVIPIERIEITCPRYVYMGSTYTLTAKVYPENATETFSFYCSDERYVQFEKEGGATFTVKKNDGIRVLFWAECDQSNVKSENVEAVLAYPLSIVNADTGDKYTNYSTYSVTVRDVLNLRLQVFTENQEPESIRWYNLESLGGGINISITTDQETGKNCTVTAQNAGKAGINVFVRIHEEDYLYAVLFNVQEAPQQVIRIEEQDLVLTVGDVHKLKISTENITGNLKYLSKNPQIVSFDAYGRITALSPGEAEIQVASPDDSVKAACKVLVKEKPSIELSSTEITLEAGSVASVGASLLNGEGTLTYESDNDPVASVSPEGQITANTEGIANIKISLEGSELSVTLKVTVVAPTEPTPEPSPEPTPEPSEGPTPEPTEEPSGESTSVAEPTPDQPL
ncbi:MAG: Ig domain-containing protein [Eubacteriales bacterium]